ncbi:hypothetical protein [Lentzea sp. NBRC 102530]|uniref:hypothetical protein n=1 Tax=Lentzea sp. NBRC 102530 TaxID=3032201 RepID=UPI0024A5A282|nr:hypothetical protein [Lentzea sp. NBRC 102530]GLY53589.1 hypothetical protein Lesp01_72450 [Lentzea sp. NBRC 102530]
MNRQKAEPSMHPDDRQDQRRWTPPTPVADPVTHSPGRPLIGYIRVRPDTSETRFEVLRRAMAAFASREGFVISRILVDRTFEHTAAFTELLAALGDGEARHVLVPALHHFGHCDGVQLAMKELLESNGARVLLLFPSQAAGTAS